MKVMKLNNIILEHTTDLNQNPMLKITVIEENYTEDGRIQRFIAKGTIDLWNIEPWKVLSQRRKKLIY